MNGWLGKSVLTLTCLLMVQNIALAYEEITHEGFSKYAADNSVLKNDPSLLGDYGLSPYGTIEYKNSKNENADILTLIAFGSKFEDDGGTIFQLISPFRTKRFFRHFFDPQSGSGLTFLTESFPPSPDWALERNLAGAPLDDPKQAYSYKDARDYFYAAFTCQTAQCRQDNFSRTFQSIGQAIHHLQDMGQPQHSRLDTHPLEPGNFYEKYTATKDTELTAIINANLYPPPVSGGNYFNLPRNYWQTGDGKGMAEFTGTNFVTIGTMFQLDKNTASGFKRHKSFPLPTGADVIKRTYQVTLTGIGNESLSDSMEFLEGTVTDPLNGANGRTWSSVQLATISALDAHLNGNELGFDGEPLNVLTVNSKVFDDRHMILMPRIAAFSTDFINYFFRGHIDMVEDAGAPDSWRIVNNSTETMSGRFDLYSESNGDRTVVTGWNLTLPPGGSSAPVTFQPPGSAVSNYVLAFRGQLGVETGAVAGRVLNLNVCTQNCAECGTPLTPSGGQSSQPQQFTYNVSSQSPQDLSGFFEAYDIPDQLQVYGNGNLLFDTGGLVSGLKEFSIAYDPSVHGTSLDVFVNAPNSGTAWNFCLDCNSSVSTCGLFNSRVTVQAKVTGSGLSCSATAVFSGRTSFSSFVAYNGGSGYSIYPKLLPGQYSLNLQNFSSQCTLGTISDTVAVSIYLNGKLLTAVGLLGPSSTFYVPAIPNLE